MEPVRPLSSRGSVEETPEGLSVSELSRFGERAYSNFDLEILPYMISLLIKYLVSSEL